MTRAGQVGGTVAALFLLLGCGHGGSGETTAAYNAPVDDAAVIQVWTEFMTAFVEGDGEAACSLGTDQFQEQLVSEVGAITGGAADCEEAVADGAGQIDSASSTLDELRSGELSKSLKVIYEGSSATVYDPCLLLEWRPLTYEDGRWLMGTEGPIPPELGDEEPGGLNLPQRCFDSDG